MTAILHGVVHGKTIELTEPANLPEGGAVRVMVLDDARSNGAGSSFPSPPGFERCRDAFLLDLPALLMDKKTAGKWFLYHDERRIKAAKSQRDLVLHCQKQGWDAKDCYIDMAIPHAPEPETIDPSLLEFED
jgi:hypothetical protein